MTYSQNKSWAMWRLDVEASLRSAGVASANAEARWLTETVSGYESGEWSEIATTEPRAAQITRLESLVGRRVAGEPLQYVLGEWPFRSLDLMVDARVLIPRQETEYVVDFALEQIDLCAGSQPNVVDLGTGSGAIALSIGLERRSAVVHATDLSEDSLEVARLNGVGNGISNVVFHLGSWFEALPENLRGTIDVLVSNPPYVAENDRENLAVEVLDYEPRRALFSGPDGLDAIRVILRDAPQWLRKPGYVIIEHSPEQAEEIRSVAAEIGFTNVRTEMDLAGRERALIAEWS